MGEQVNGDWARTAGVSGRERSEALGLGSIPAPTCAPGLGGRRPRPLRRLLPGSSSLQKYQCQLAAEDAITWLLLAVLRIGENVCEESTYV